MIVKTEAIVLRSRKFRETSSIVTLYSREFGRISVVGKGARGPRNKFGSSLQPLSHISAVIYKHEGRDLHLLSQCDAAGRFPRLDQDLERFSAAMSVVELLDHVAHDEQRNDRLFEFTLDVLRAIDNAPHRTGNIRFFFELHLSDLLGFRPDFQTCLACGESLDGGRLGTKGAGLRLSSGGALCCPCSDDAGIEDRVSREAVQFIQKLQAMNDPGSATQLDITTEHSGEVGSILRQYLQSHVGGLQRLKAQSVAARIAESSMSTTEYTKNIGSS